MKAYAIVLKDNPISEHGFKVLRESHDKVKNNFPLIRYNAFTPIQAHEYCNDHKNGFRWTWPWEGEQLDIELGIIKKAYATNNPHARVACFLSHYHLWKKCADKLESILVLEHDVKFIRKVPNISMTFSAASINDPRGATRKSQIYHDKIQSQPAMYGLVEAPWVDDNRAIAQGLPGNSAYIITPAMAKMIIAFVEKHGAWPNDATICKQNFPNKLFCLQQYCTMVQGLRSTTTQ